MVGPGMVGWWAQGWWVGVPRGGGLVCSCADGGTGDASRSRRVPATHSVVSTRLVERLSTTVGEVTAPRPRSNMDAWKAFVLAASY